LAGSQKIALKSPQSANGVGGTAVLKREIHNATVYHFVPDRR
jgi:hypothetical protein